MKDRYWILIGLAIALALVLGSYLGVQKFKSSCEPMGNIQGQRWLECNE